jgi:PAS domain S-box-containing protein
MVNSIDDVTLSLLSRLVTAHAEEDVMSLATELIVEVSGARAAASFLVAGNEVAAEHWHGSDDVLRERVESALASQLDGSRVQEMSLDDPEMRRLRVSSRSAGEHRLYMAVLAFDDRPTEVHQEAENADRIVEIVAAKLAVERQLFAARTDLAKYKRWLELSNSHMQILDRERQKFMAVVSQSDTLMFVSDGEHVAQWTNTALKTRLEELGSERVVDLTVQDIWDLLEVDCAPSRSPGCPVARVFREGMVVHSESRQGAADGTRNLYLTFLPVKAVDGKTVEVLVMIQDLSDLESLRRSESRYRHLFERSPNAMIMASDDTGDILLANPAASKLTGYPARELAETTLEDLHEPGDWIRANKEYERVVQRSEVRRSERRIRSKSGRTISASVTASRFDLDGRPVTLLDLQDVTKQRQLEVDLRRSQKMEVVGILASGMTHELDDAMALILAQAEKLKARSGSDPSLLEIAGTTEKASVHASAITRNLIAFSRKDVGKREVLDLNSVLQAIQELLLNLLGERVLLHLKLSDEPCLVEGDRTQLEEIAINLAANARDAMTHGGNFLLEVSYREPEQPDAPGRVCLLVRDDGAVRDSLTGTPLAGAGLGMGTITRIVEDHDGAIEVESDPVEGNTFRITFPRVPETR